MAKHRSRSARRSRRRGGADTLVSSGGDTLVSKSECTGSWSKVETGYKTDADGKADLDAPVENPLADNGDPLGVCAMDQPLPSAPLMEGDEEGFQMAIKGKHAGRRRSRHTRRHRRHQRKTRRSRK